MELTNETFESLYSMLSFAREELLMHQNLSMPCINGEKNERFVEHEKARDEHSRQAELLSKYCDKLQSELNRRIYLNY